MKLFEFGVFLSPVDAYFL